LESGRTHQQVLPLPFPTSLDKGSFSEWSLYLASNWKKSEIARTNLLTATGYTYTPSLKGVHDKNRGTYWTNEYNAIV
ncbi:hypothetical protein SK128_017356, partial [Halocaridina rubra]